MYYYYFLYGIFCLLSEIFLCTFSASSSWFACLLIICQTVIYMRLFFCLAEIRFSSLTSYLNKQIDLRMMELNKSSNPKSPNQSHQHTRRTGKHERPPPLKITTQTLSNFNSYWSESGTSEWDCFSILVSSCCSTYIHLCAKTCFSLFVEMR